MGELIPWIVSRDLFFFFFFFFASNDVFFVRGKRRTSIIYYEIASSLTPSRVDVWLLLFFVWLKAEIGAL